MIKRIAFAAFILLSVRLEASPAGDLPQASATTNLLEIRSVIVDGKTLTWRPGGDLRLQPFPPTVSFIFGPPTNSPHLPIRLRYKLEGFDSAWHEGGGEMFVAVRFLDESGEQVDQQIFRARGASPGWNGSLETSTLTHRREKLTVPPRASQLWFIISSAGPPAAVGLLVVDDLVVSRLSPTNGPAEVLLRSPFGSDAKGVAAAQQPVGWLRDGIRPSMAKIVELGLDPAARAFAILDEDPIGHAEWHNLKEFAPHATPGDQLVVEWNELFTMGVGDVRAAHYGKLPAGDYRFRVLEVTALGAPTGVEASLKVLVPLPLWEQPWFLGAVVTSVTLGIVGTSRYFARQRMRRAMLRLEHQGMLERERIRIAQDIHDDLGARVTQISLLSAMAQANPAFPEKAREDFDNITRMSRDLVSALYETVWTVNPENDNLDALGNYLCQMVNQLCDQARLRCRLHVLDLPTKIQVSSQIRHNITLAVKEAVHNVIKHARASEVTLEVTLAGRELIVSVQDNGCGFEPGNGPPGYGLTNMKRRLIDIGGSCSIESQAGRGTTVRLRLAVDLAAPEPDHRAAQPADQNLEASRLKEFKDA